MDTDPAADALRQIDESFERLRASEAELHGFWRAAPDKGVWRIAAIWREGRWPDHEQELATVLSWPNEKAQELACRMLGLEGPMIHELFDAAACHQALATHAAVWSSSHFDAGWSTAPQTGSPDAGHSSTCRLMCWDRNDLLCLAASFEILARATGGCARHSDAALGADAAALAAACFPLPFDPAQAVQARWAIKPQWDIISARSERDPARPLRVDARALARHLGVPAQASLLSTHFAGMESALLSKAKIEAKMRSMGQKAFEADCHIDPSALGLQGEDQILAACMARQESSLMRAELSPGAPSKSKPGL